jgi:phage terminase small subunit
MEKGCHMNILKNTKHEHFCQLMSNGESATKAYILSGYSENGADRGASRLLRNVEVCSRIDYLRRRKEELHMAKVGQVIQKIGISKEWVIEQLVNNVRIAKTAEPVLNNEGLPTGEYRVNIPAANKALELIGIELGMFVKRVETGGPGDFEKLTDDEIEQKIKDTERALGIARDAVGAASASSKASTAKKKV